LPSFGKPVLVVRNETERIEGLLKGWSIMTGYDKNKIVTSFESLKKWHNPGGGNPYGNGKAAIRIARYINEYFH